MEGVTALHYTSSQEDENFTRLIWENNVELLGDLPLITVSQKPLPESDWNICVGEHLNCYFNMARQIQIGLREITTPFTLIMEGDFLYPPEYFTFKPPELHNYAYDNVWVLFDRHPPNRFHFKGKSSGAAIIPTQLWLARVNALLAGKSDWWTSPADDFKYGDIFPKYTAGYTWTGQAAITFKTKHNVKKSTQTEGVAKSSLPYWGNAQAMKEDFIRS